MLNVPNQGLLKRHANYTRPYQVDLEFKLGGVYVGLSQSLRQSVGVMELYLLVLRIKGFHSLIMVVQDEFLFFYESRVVHVHVRRTQMNELPQLFKRLG